MLPKLPFRLGEPLVPALRAEIRRTLELRCFKWDAQIGDIDVLSRAPLLLARSDWHELATHAVRLFRETLALEQALLENRRARARLGLPRALARVLDARTLTPTLARVMRFDFHFTKEGWRISEVNSDVPGGYAEATHFTRLVAAHVPGSELTGDPTRTVVTAIEERVGAHALVAFTCAPGHIEDQQVVAHLAAACRERGLCALVVSPPQIGWRDGQASVVIRDRGAVRVDALFRFYQAEWLARLAPRVGWRWMLSGGRLPVTNPAAAVLSESKRLPLVWDELGVSLETWRRLLPETRSLAEAPWTTDDGWLIKSAYSNTGDTVSVRALLSQNEWLARAWRARLQPSAWVAQRRFEPVPLDSPLGPRFACIGVYVVNGVAAGAYARLARGPVVDFSAEDAALLLYGET
jgi:glutathionylspermidine synthase